MSISVHILKKVKRFLMYPLWLIIGSGVVVMLFSLLYYLLDAPNPIKYSLNLYIGSASIMDSVYVVSVIEIVAKYIFSVTFIAEFLTKFIEPINPIVTSKFFIYDEIESEIKFRYWIVLPNDQHLYNIHIRIFTITEQEKTSGEGSLNNYSKFILEDSSLEMARGVRTAKLVKSDDDYPRILFELLNSNEDKSLYLMISAITEKGKRINYTRKYSKDNLIKNCEFVPIRSTSFYPELKRKVFFRYHYFDKLYIPSDADNKKTVSLSNNFPQAKNAILTEDEVKTKKYGTKKHVLNDLYSEVISWYLNR